MKEIVPDYRLDMVGEPCPYPALPRLKLPQQEGEILEVVSDCRAVHQQHSAGCEKPRLYGAGYPAGWPNHSLSDSKMIAKGLVRGLYRIEL
jgi:TusA-related sulfurtransferase